jgi:hypothetical protein
METAIILEGFKNSVAMHNLKYIKIIGDGDSSVYRKIRVDALRSTLFHRKNRMQKSNNAKLL